MTIKNLLLTRTNAGYRLDQNSTSITAFGVRESFLSLTSTSDSASASGVITGYLNAYGNGDNVLTAELVPTSDVETPYVGLWGPGSTITVPRPSAENAPEVVYVRSMSVSMSDANGALTFRPELIMQGTTARQQAELRLRALNAGTLDGRANAATIAGDLDSDVRAGRVRTFEETFSQPTIEVKDSGVIFPSDYGRLQSVFATLRTAGSTSTTFQIKINNSAVTFSQSGGTSSSTITLSAGQGAIFGMTTSQVDVWPTYPVQMSTTGVGTGATDLVVKLVFGER